MRWARTRGLPVRRIPGGKTATVYALRDELDRWAAQQADAEPVPATKADGQAFSQPPRRRLGIAIAAVAVVLTALGAAWALRPGADPVPARDASVQPLPADPALSDLYLQARDDWALRTPAALARAIAALETVTRRDPRFAPAFSALADTWLLAREFGGVSDAEAFEKARSAASASLQLDPDLAAAHRAMGFILYWADNDPVAAGRAFRRALALTPNSAQTHFWYGNVLSDNGAHEAALRELNQARLLEPGSVAIQTDLAWAEWSSGRQTDARATLDQLAISAPDFPVVQDCLSILRLAEGDVAGYVAAFTRYAELRGDETLQRRARGLSAALSQGVPAARRQIAANALSDAGNGGVRDRAWAAFVFSAAGDRKALLQVLHRADAARERWGSAGATSRIRDRWAGDPEVLRLLDRRRPLPVE